MIIITIYSVVLLYTTNKTFYSTIHMIGQKKTNAKLHVAWIEYRGAPKLSQGILVLAQLLRCHTFDVPY